MKILIVCYGGGHARLLRPVIDLLLDREDCQVFCLALTSAAREFSGVKAENFRLYGYKDFFGSDTQVLKRGATLAAQLNNVIDLKETICYLGKNYNELVQQEGSESVASERYQLGGRQIFLPVNALVEIITLLKPEVVVTTNSPRSEKAALMAAQKLGIRCVSIIDMFSYRCEGWIAEFSDTVCVFDAVVAERLRSLNPNVDVRVTGNPSFDGLVSRFNKDKQRLLINKMAMPFTVLWASQQEPEFVAELGANGNVQLPSQVEAELVRIFSAHRDWRLIIRNHPNEVPRKYPDFVKISDQKQSLDDLLENVHVVITLTSTVGLQGRIVGCQLITVEGSVFTSTVPFASAGYSIGISDITLLEDRLLSLAAQSQEAPIIPPPYIIADAAKRVLDAIINF